MNERKVVWPSHTNILQNTGINGLHSFHAINRENEEFFKIEESGISMTMKLF